MSEDFAVLSAVLDRDPVDIRELEMMLDDPTGRRAFVDFVRLRQAAAADTEVPGSEFRDRLARHLAVKPRIGARSLPLPLAAAAILLALLFGSLLDLNFMTQDRAAAAPPEPVRVLRFEPGVDWHP